MRNTGNREDFMSAFKKLAFLVSFIIANQSYALVDGINVKNDEFQNVVFLSTRSGPCTALLINPRIALTAAHCVEARPEFISLSNTADKHQGNESNIEVMYSKAHPSYTGVNSILTKDPAVDIGFILLSKDAPFKKIPLSSFKKDELFSKTVFNVAFGNPGEMTHYKKYQKTSVLAEEKQLSSPIYLYTKYMGEPGDSGSPLFDSDGKILAIASTTKANFFFQKGHSRYALISAAVSWLNDEIGFHFESSDTNNSDQVICSLAKNDDLKNSYKFALSLNYDLENGEYPSCFDADAFAKNAEVILKETYAYKKLSAAKFPSEEAFSVAFLDISFGAGEYEYQSLRKVGANHEEALGIIKDYLIKSDDYTYSYKKLRKLKNTHTEAIQIIQLQKQDLSFDIYQYEKYRKNKLSHLDSLKKLLN